MRKLSADGTVINEAPLVKYNPAKRDFEFDYSHPFFHANESRTFEDAPVVRRTPRARFEQVLQTLITDAREQFQRTGYIAWPQSIVAELKAMGWKEGKPDMWNEVELLARKYIEEGANKAKATNSKFVTTPGHGH